MAERPKSRKPKPLHPPSSLSINGESLNPNPKMSRNSLLLKQTLAAIFIILAIYAFFNAFVSPVDRNHANLDVNLSFDSTGGDGGSDSSCGSRSAPAPVKVFLYDLPRKFTYGVIESYLRAREATKSPLGRDVSSLTYPGHQHSAEWWLFSDLIRDDDRRRGSPVVRVLDPEEADLFYVPFLSSLSLVVNPIRPVGIVGEAAVYSDEEMQESLVEWLEEQVYWKRNNGWDHVFICQDPNALYKVIDRVKNGILLVSDFGRLRKEQASLVKDVILPYSHRINSFNGDVGVHDRGVLLFFMGNRYRKAGGKVRDLLFQVLDKEKDCIVTHGTQSRESRRVATHGMHSSKFCLHPAGDTPSACRLFDAIVSLCVPVIVSDYVELPFEDVIDYRKIAIFVDTNNAVMPRYLVKLLRGISKERIVEYQQELKKVKRYFEYEDPNGAVNEIWRQVSQKVPYTKLMINRDKRLVRRDLTEPDCACICSNKTASIGPFNTTDGNSEF